MTKDTRASRRSPRGETFVPLLSALLVVLVISPFAEGSPLASALLVSIVLVTGVFALHRSVWLRGSMAVALLLVVGLRWVAHAYGDKHAALVPAAHLAISAYLLVLAVTCVLVVLRRRRVTRDTIIGAVCGYMLIAFVFAFAYAALADAVPKSFVSSVVLQEYHGREIGRGTPELLYYSFVVLTTVGFGDITPANPAARSLAMLEMVAGQLYLAAFVARLVGVMGTELHSDAPPSPHTNAPSGEAES